MTIEQDVRTAFKNNQVVIGKERTMKFLQQGRLTAVVYASNARQQDIDDAAYKAAMVKVPLLNAMVPNDELRLWCKKPYSISFLGIVKGKE